MRYGSASTTPSLFPPSILLLIDSYVPNPKNIASLFNSIFLRLLSLTSVLSTNFTPSSSRIFLRLSTTFFSSLNSGIPYVRRPPISSYLSYTVQFAPLRMSVSAQANPAGPAPIIEM